MRVILIAAAIWLIPFCASAFEPEPGNRAYPIVGRDMISGEMIDLDDHLGKWVLLCFYTTR